MSAQTLFPEPLEGEKTWTRQFSLPGGAEIAVPLYESAIAAEIRDQISLKASVRRAALRSSQKSIRRMAKMGLARLDAAQMEELRWSLFICHVDAAIGDRHLKLREDEAAQTALVKDPSFSA